MTSAEKLFSTSIDKQRVKEAFSLLLQSLDIKPVHDFSQHAEYATSLWLDWLICPDVFDVSRWLASCEKSPLHTPVSVCNIGIHLVCPHHLTVALGYAHVAYLPNQYLAGFAQLADLVKACTARLVLQEQANQDIANILVEHLQARAAVAWLEAIHPCHNVTQPRSHAAKASTWAYAGNPQDLNELKNFLLAAKQPVN